jgi:hypothetical protein
MSDAIVEAAARALELEVPDYIDHEDGMRLACCVLAAVTPMIEEAYVKSRSTIHVAAIRNATLEEAAAVAEGYYPELHDADVYDAQQTIAAAIRALKEQP